MSFDVELVVAPDGTVKDCAGLARQIKRYGNSCGRKIDCRTAEAPAGRIE